MQTISKAGLEEFGRRLKSLMIKSDLRNNGDLATRASKAAGYKITRQMVHKWVNGISYASEKNRLALASVFGVPVEQITIHHVDGQPVTNAPLSNSRVPFRMTQDKHNPMLVRAEMSDFITRDQAEKIAAILGVKKVP